MNVFILLGRNKISKIVFIVEIIISLIYFATILIGPDRPTTKENYIINENEIFVIIQLLIHISLISNIIYTLFKIYQNNDTINLYQKRIKKWASLSFLFFLIVLGILIMVGVYVINKNQFNYNDTRISLLLLRFISILFVIFRPSHIDEIGIPYLKKLRSENRISIQNFEFIFFSNYYYLKPSANLEDFATMLNNSKTEVVAFIQTLGEVNFNEMLNKNRILYFTELLKNKKYESLTIEALSEISGFGSRNTMYNAFNKYHGMTPTEFIMIHK
jgi:AraC-like DNA-binding protein